jgi:hypothetical protein
VALSSYGDSVGHYEGETLVIDTVGVRVDRPFAMIDMFGTPYASALHVVERYRLIDYKAAKQVQDRAGTQLYRLPVGRSRLVARPCLKRKRLATGVYHRGAFINVLVGNHDISARGAGMAGNVLSR